ncbi:MAG: serine/threonine protein kinase [Deltaproteobacteria bacterium]|nr:serine/threonine protein kinase [Deltaproteobacteria bacterium]
MGCVYLAEHISIQRPVALKLLHPGVGEIEEVTRRFEREAFAIGRVDHPNCVKVSDFGKLSDGTFYMVLELLDGLLLFDLLDRERRVEWRRALHIARHVLSALSYAHDAGIIHRDIKPENVILVDEDDDPDFAKILDFGIAKLHDDAKADQDTGLMTNDAKLTQHGVTIGTPTYIAPEQAYGLPIDGRADLYSLSVMLYEMITGVPPFDADEVGALLRMHVSADVPTFDEVAPELEVPEAVERLLRHGLEKKADERIGTAQQYIDRIDELVELKEHHASGLREIPLRIAGSLRRTLTPVVTRVVPRRRGTGKMLAAALAVMGLIGIIAFAFGGGEPDVSETIAPQGEAQGLVFRGHELTSADRNLEALSAYENAISLEPELAANRRMRNNVEKMLAKRSPRVVDAALDFLGKLVSETHDWAAADQLVDLASSSKSRQKRHKAMSIASEVGLGDQVDRLGSYLLDLRRGESCGARKDAVANLRALGDKKAIPALRKARKRIRSDGGIVKQKLNTNACLRADATEAVRYLQTL